MTHAEIVSSLAAHLTRIGYPVADVRRLYAERLAFARPFERRSPWA
jgi:hypothetical protein